MPVTTCSLCTQYILYTSSLYTCALYTFPVPHGQFFLIRYMFILRFSVLQFPTLPTHSGWLVRVRGLLRRPVLFYTVLDCTVPFRSVLCCSVEMKGHALSFRAFLLFRLTIFYTKMPFSLAEDTSLPISRSPAIQKPLNDILFLYMYEAHGQSVVPVAYSFCSGYGAPLWSVQLVYNCFSSVPV
jgi:hypothetical protein